MRAYIQQRLKQEGIKFIPRMCPSRLFGESRKGMDTKNLSLYLLELRLPTIWRVRHDSETCDVWIEPRPPTSSTLERVCNQSPVSMTRQRGLTFPSTEQ